MKVGDMVKHVEENWNSTAIVIEIDNTNLVGILRDGKVSFIHKKWIEVIKWIEATSD